MCQRAKTEEAFLILGNLKPKNVDMYIPIYRYIEKCKNF